MLLSIDNVLVQLGAQLMLDDLNSLITFRGALKGGLGHVESRHFVREHHVKRGRRASFLHVSIDTRPVQMWSSEKQALQLRRITMVVEVDVPVACEQVVERVIQQSVRVSAFVVKNHQVRHIDYPHAQLRNPPSEERRRCDNFEHDLDTDPHKNHIRSDAVVRTAKFPNRSTCAAMVFCFFG